LAMVIELLLALNAHLPCVVSHGYWWKSLCRRTLQPQRTYAWPCSPCVTRPSLQTRQCCCRYLKLNKNLCVFCQLK
jgi:hypothetical protein